jgi:hypothetical protein
VSSSNHLDFDIQPNTVAKAGTGALLVGYGSSSWRVNYGSDTERRRTIVIPERFDIGPGKNPKDPHGIKLGSVIVYSNGSIQLENLRQTPSGVAAGQLAVVDGTLRLFNGTRWTVIGGSLPPATKAAPGQ